MLFNHNIKPYSLTETIDDDQEYYTEETLPLVHRNGARYFMVILTDHSMFDRFYKEDLLTVRLQNTCSSGQDAVVILPDDTVTAAQLTYQDATARLSYYNRDTYSSVTFPKDAITILGVICGAVRIN